MIFNFSDGAVNHLLVNPRLSTAEKSIFAELLKAFEIKYGSKNYFLVPSSGTSKKANQSVKLIALHRDAILNSAQRFNDYFGATAQQHWGLVLPKFHVAGLATFARAYLAQAKVFENTWNQPEIKFLSIVPAQLFDFVAQNQKCPDHLEKVFIGAGFLNTELKQKALQLNWPLIESYGMTETASMIAVKQNLILETLPEVQVTTVNQLLKIKCNSLLTCYMQKIDNQVIFTEPLQDGWYQTEDQAQLNGDQIKLLGRSSEYIKILGEGVSLAELKDKLAAISLRHNISFNALALLEFDDLRAGHELILAVDKSVNSETINLLLGEFNQSVRPYERVTTTVWVDQIPLSDLGKVRTQELKEIILQKRQGKLS